MLRADKLSPFFMQNHRRMQSAMLVKPRSNILGSCVYQADWLCVTGGRAAPQPTQRKALGVSQGPQQEAQDSFLTPTLRSTATFIAVDSGACTWAWGMVEQVEQSHLAFGLVCMNVNWKYSFSPARAVVKTGICTETMQHHSWDVA